MITCRWETLEYVLIFKKCFSSSMIHFHQSFSTMTTECSGAGSPYPYMVIPSINRFSLPLLGSYYRIHLSMDLDSRLGSCYWYIQGNDWYRWCNDKMTYMAREISPHCYIGWSLSVASHRHSSQHVDCFKPARGEFACRHWVLPSDTGAEDIFTINMVS